MLVQMVCQVKPVSLVSHLIFIQIKNQLFSSIGREGMKGERGDYGSPGRPGPMGETADAEKGERGADGNAMAKKIDVDSFCLCFITI